MTKSEITAAEEHRKLREWIQDNADEAYASLAAIVRASRTPYTSLPMLKRAKEVMRDLTDLGYDMQR